MLVGGEDYVPVTNKSLVFAYGFGFGLVQCVHIPILNDECFEDLVQSFNVLLSTTQDCVRLNETNIQVSILDDDGELVFWKCVYS